VDRFSKSFPWPNYKEIRYIVIANTSPCIARLQCNIWMFKITNMQSRSKNKSVLKRNLRKCSYLNTFVKFFSVKSDGVFREPILFNKYTFLINALFFCFNFFHFVSKHASDRWIDRWRDWQNSHSKIAFCNSSHATSPYKINKSSPIVIW